MIEPKWRSWLSLSFFLSPFIFRVWLQEQTWGSLGERPRAPVKDRGRGQTPGGGPTVLLCHKGPLLFRPPFERVMLRWRGQMMQIPARPLASTHAASPDITGCLSSPLLQGCFTTIEPQKRLHRVDRGDVITPRPWQRPRMPETKGVGRKPGATRGGAIFLQGRGEEVSICQRDGLWSPKLVSSSTAGTTDRTGHPTSSRQRRRSVGGCYQPVA